MSLTDQQIEFYSRQIILRELGGIGQRRLLEGTCLVRGSGPAARFAVHYLAGAGVGRIALEGLDPAVDRDLFPPPQDRNPDTSVQTPRPDSVLSDYDVLIEAPGHPPRAEADWSGRSAKLGEIRIAESAPGIVIDLLPAGTACLDCVLPPPPGAAREDPIGLQQAGSLAALAALRWLTGPAEPLTCRRIAMGPQDPCWETRTLQRRPECPRPCRS